MKEQPPVNTETLFFTTQDFLKIDWEGKYQEFEWNGSLYDVSRIEKTKEGYKVYCVNDNEEESIIGLFNEWKKSNSPHGKLKVQFQPQFCSRLTSEQQLLFSKEIKITPERDNLYHCVIERIPSPPPENSL